MKSRETVIRLKKFQVDEKRRRVAQIESMIADFERKRKWILEGAIAGLLGSVIAGIASVRGWRGKKRSTRGRQRVAGQDECDRAKTKSLP